MITVVRCLLLLAALAGALGAQRIVGIRPYDAVSGTQIVVQVSCEFSTGGYSFPQIASVQISGSTITVRVFAARPTGVVTQAITVQDATVNMGFLSRGEYTISAFLVLDGQTVSSATGPLSVFDFSAAPASLSFFYTRGGPLPPAQSLTLSKSKLFEGGIQFRASPASANVCFTYPCPGFPSWLAVDPASGLITSLTRAITVSVSPSGWAAGKYTGLIHVSLPEYPNAGRTVTVTLTVTDPPPPAGLTISPPLTTVQTVAGGPPPPPQPISVGSTGAPVAFLAAAQLTSPAPANWLSIDRTSGTAPTTINALINQAGLPPGRYQGQVRVNRLDGSGVQTAEVVANVTSGQTTLVVTPDRINFTAVKNGPAPPLQTFSFSALPASTRAVSVVSSSQPAGWLAVSLVPPTTPGSAQATVTPSAAGLDPGVYAGAITVSGASFSNSPQTIAVTLTVTQPVLLTATPSQLSMSATQGGLSQSREVSVNSNGPALAFGANVTQGVGWLTLSSLSGTTPGSLTVTANPVSLSVGTHSGAISVSAPGVAAVTISVNFDVTQGASPLVTGVSQLTYNLTAGSGSSSDSLLVSSPGTSIPFGASTATQNGGAWLSVSPSRANTPVTLSVAVSPAALVPGTYTGSIALSPDSGSGTVIVPVIMTVSQRGTQTGAANRLAVTHLADGDNWRTTIVLVNTDTQDAAFTMTFRGGQGASLALPIVGLERISSIRGSIPPNGSRTYQTAGNLNGPLLTGWAELTSDQMVRGLAVFRQTTATVQEGTSAAIPPSPRFVMPFDNTQNLNSAVAVANTNAAQPAVITSLYRDETGGEIFRESFTLPPGGQSSYGTVGCSQPSPECLKRSNTLVNRRGVVELSSSSGEMTMMGLRFNPFNSFTSLEAVGGGQTGSQAMSQLADGTGWKTTMVLVNNDVAASPFSLRFRDSNGTPLSLPFEALGMRSVLEDTLPPLGTRTYQTEGLAEILRQGWAELNSSRSISGLAIFRQRQSSEREQEASVPVFAVQQREFWLPYDNTGEFITAASIVNPDAVRAATVAATVYDEQGGNLENATVLLPPGGYKPFRLADELPATAGRRGVVRFRSSNLQFTVLGLRFTTAGALTSFPAFVRNGSTQGN